MKKQILSPILGLGGAGKLQTGLVPKTGLDPPKSFDSGRFCPTKFYGVFSVVFRLSREGWERGAPRSGREFIN